MRPGIDRRASLRRDSKLVTGDRRQINGRRAPPAPDQDFDVAAIARNEGAEIRAAGHDHADALDLHVGDAQTPAAVLQLPLDLDRRIAARLVEQAFDQKDAVGTGYHPADGHRLAAILAETLAVGARFGGRGGFQEARPLVLVGLGPIGTECRLTHVRQVETAEQHGRETGLAVRTGLGLDQFDRLRRHLGDGLCRIGGEDGEGKACRGKAGSGRATRRTTRSADGTIAPSKSPEAEF